jgi:8-oxo-dGTP pyrophosphatase MutT (NUDIX family)
MKITISESALKDIMRYEKNRIQESDVRTDKYGNAIPKNGQGYGPDPSMMNRQGYNADGTKGPWFSRSVAVATAVLLNDNGKWYILAGQRGTGTPDYQGYWNLPCGYLDYNEDTQEAAVREVYEETGIKLDKSQMKPFGSSSSPYENRQNVVFFYVAILNGNTGSLPFSKDNMEENEVDGLQWLPIEKCGTLRWAFDHDELIKKIIAKYSHKINGEQISGTGTERIRKAIQVLRDGGDTDYAIEILQSLL